MSWISTNLSGAMGNVTSKIDGAIGTLQKAIGDFDKQVQANLNLFSSALGVVSGTKSLLDKMQEAGIYTLILDPQIGSWAARMQNADNAPPSGSGYYCCGSVNLTITPDLAGAVSALEKMKTAFEKPLSAAADNIKEWLDNDGDVFEPDPEPEELELVDLDLFKSVSLDTLFSPNSWHSATLGDVFGGAMQAASEELNTAVNAGRSLLSRRNTMGAAKFLLNKGKTTIDKLLSEMSATGVYSIMLEPGSGNYLSRLKTEAGAPPQDSNLYSSGIAVISVAPSLTDLDSKFATMNRLMKGI